MIADITNEARDLLREIAATGDKGLFVSDAETGPGSLDLARQLRDRGYITAMPMLAGGYTLLCYADIVGERLLEALAEADEVQP